MKCLEYQGMRLSLKQFASMIGLSYRMTSYYNQKGLDAEAIARIASGQTDEADDIYLYQGRMTSLSEIAVNEGVNVSSIRAYLRYGHSLDEAIERSNKQERNIPGRQTMPGVIKVDPKSLFYKQRLAAGFTPEEAVIIPGFISRNSYYKQQEFMRQHGYEPKPGETLNAIAQNAGISLETLQRRLERGFSWEDAISRKVTEAYANRKNNETLPVDHLGNVYENLNAMCYAWGVSRELFNNRIRIGWTLRDALETPLLISAGEKTISEILESKGVVFYRHKSLRTIFTRLGLYKDFHDFVDMYVSDLKSIGINVSPEKIRRMQYNFTLIQDGGVFAFIEYDEDTNFKFIQMFHQTFIRFLGKHNKDKFKNMFAEAVNIPLLRIKKSQLPIADQMIEDLLKNPARYQGSHNAIETDAKYWCEDEKKLSSISELALE